MILYNVTVNIDEEVLSDWISWMQDTHIPEVMRTGFFYRHRMLRLLNDQPDSTGVTCAIQYELEDIGKLDEYLANHAPALQQKHLDRYGNKCLAFRTVLEEI